MAVGGVNQAPASVEVVPPATYTIPRSNNNSGMGTNGRCLSNVKGDSTRHLFLAGVSSPAGVNEVHVLEHNGTNNDLSLQQSVIHPAGEIWHLASHPKEASVYLSASRTPSSTQCHLVKMPSLSSTSVTTIPESKKVEITVPLSPPEGSANAKKEAPPEKSKWRSCFYCR